MFVRNDALSETQIWHSPWVAKQVLKQLIVVWAVEFETGNTSTHFEQESMIT